MDKYIYINIYMNVMYIQKLFSVLEHTYYYKMKKKKYDGDWSLKIPV